MRLSIKLSLGLIPLVLAGVVGYAIWAFHPFWLEEGTCQLRPVSFPLRKMHYLPYRTPTSECNDIPTGVPANARFFELESPTFHMQGWIWNKRGEFQLLLDQNQDGVADNDPSFWGRQTHGPYEKETLWRFGPFEIPLKQHDRLSERFYLLSYEDRIVTLFPAQVYTGRMWLKHKVYRIYLNDTDLDGAMNSLFDPNVMGSDYPLCDAMVLTDNPGKTLYPNEFPWARMVRIGTQYYTVELSPDRQCSLLTIEPQYGNLMLKGIDQARVSFYSDAATDQVELSHQIVSLPAGRYHMLDLDFEILDSEQVPWTLHCSRLPKSWANIEIVPNQTCTLEIGPPLQVVVYVRQQERDLVLTLNFKGKSGETYRQVLSNRGRSKPPSFTIINEHGEILKRGRFEYG